MSGLIAGPVQVFVETDWHDADGAELTPDDQVVPLAHLGTTRRFDTSFVVPIPRMELRGGSQPDPDEPAAA